MQTHYTPTKAGLLSLMQSCAVALGPYGICCNALLPGTIETDINRDDLADSDKRDYTVNRTLLGRLGCPEDCCLSCLRHGRLSDWLVSAGRRRHVCQSAIGVPMMEMPVNTFKHSLDGEVRYGCWAGLGTAWSAEILATTGFDWLLIDGEHAPNPLPAVLGQLQAVAPYRSAPVVRAVNHDPALIKQLLDIGVQSLMVPMVETAEQAEALVRATRYPPHGIRGVGGGLTRATRWDAIPGYIENAHRELCLVVQIESPKGIDNVEAIAAVDGIDALFVGPADLSTGAGHVGNPGHPDIQAMIRRALDAAKAVGKPAGILAPMEADARTYAQWGFDFIAVGIDISLLRQAALQTLGRYKEEQETPAPSSVY